MVVKVDQQVPVLLKASVEPRAIVCVELRRVVHVGLTHKLILAFIR